MSPAQDRVRVPGLCRAADLGRGEMSPAPHERFAGPEGHVHGCPATAVALGGDLGLGCETGRKGLVQATVVAQEYAHGMRALDQVVIAHEVLVIGHGLVVAQQEDAVLVAVQVVPTAIEEDPRDRVPYGPGCGVDFEAGLTPQPGQVGGVGAAGIVAVNVEYLYGVCDLCALGGEVVAVAAVLEPDGLGLLAVAHARRDRCVDDLLHGAEQVPAVGQPGIDNVGSAHVLHAHHAVGLPGLLQGALHVHAHAQRRRAVPAVHRAALRDGILVPRGGYILDVAPGHVGGVRVGGPGLQAPTAGGLYLSHAGLYAKDQQGCQHSPYVPIWTHRCSPSILRGKSPRSARHCAA